MSEVAGERAQVAAAQRSWAYVHPDVLRDILNQWSRAALIETLIECALQDDVVRARIQSAAWRSSPPGSESAQRALVRRAFAVPQGYVDRRDMPTFVARAQSAWELLRGLVERGEARQALLLADEALHLGMAAYEYTDDSNGDFGDLLRRLAAIHLEASRSASVDGARFAAELLRLQLDDDWGLFKVDHYLPALGDQGLARYRDLAEAAWHDVPERAPGDRRMCGGQFFVLRRIMEDLARHDGDIDALAAVKARDLSKVQTFVDIAKLYADANRPQQSIDWAERGRAAFPGTADFALTEFLIAAYHGAQRYDDAATLAWEHLLAMPSIRVYRLLKSVCEPSAWLAWRDKAFAHMRALATSKRACDPSSSPSCESDLLIEMFIDEGDVPAALEGANYHGCSPLVWLAVAAACEAGHPEEAIVIYRRQVELVLQQTGSRAYDDAVALVRKIGELFGRVDRRGEFRRWVVELKGRYRARRSFIRRLEERGG